MRFTERLNPAALLLLPFSALLLVAALLVGGPAELLGMLPAILLAGALAWDRYPGEALIARLAARPRLRPSAVASAPRRRPDAAALRTLAALRTCRSLRAPPSFS